MGKGHGSGRDLLDVRAPLFEASANLRLELVPVIGRHHSGDGVVHRSFNHEGSTSMLRAPGYRRPRAIMRPPSRDSGHHGLVDDRLCIGTARYAAIAEDKA